MNIKNIFSAVLLFFLVLLIFTTAQGNDGISPNPVPTADQSSIVIEVPGEESMANEPDNVVLGDTGILPDLHYGDAPDAVEVEGIIEVPGEESMANELDE